MEEVLFTSFFTSFFCFWECNEDLFNDIASRYPIVAPFTAANSSCIDELTSLLQCSLDDDHPFIQNRLFVLTHLDHLDEDDRLKKIKEFDPYKRNIDIFI